MFFWQSDRKLSLIDNIFWPTRVVVDPSTEQVSISEGWFACKTHVIDFSEITRIDYAYKEPEGHWLWRSDSDKGERWVVSLEVRDHTIIQIGEFSSDRNSIKYVNLLKEATGKTLT